MATAPTDARVLPVLPTTGVVLPEMVVTIQIESEDARAAVESATGGGDHVVLVPRIDGASQGVGVVARIEQQGPLPNGAPGIVVRGIVRARVGRGQLDDSGALLVDVATVEDAEPTGRTKELADRYREAATRLLRQVGGRRMASLLQDVVEPGALADTIGWWPDLSDERRIELLETLDRDSRLELAATWAEEAATEAEILGGVNAKVSGELEDAQREAVLRRQMAAIREELGESSGDAGSDYRERLAELDLSDEVREAITTEIDRLERSGEQSQEASWIRTWLDTMFEIPWGERTEDDLDLGRARATLDEDHYGLDEVKDRIIEFLAVRKRRAERDVETAAVRGGTILALAGPPGVGKTSLGRSVARTLGREFVRMSLGGIRDEAEIRGHRRTYVGARPGRIVRALTEAGTLNPVILLDEIDKVGADWRGDPSSALLEVLDPAQNDTFRDHYLEVELDLSEVVFIATANELDRLPPPLLDRMEVITIGGYTEDEKVRIAIEHLLPRIFEENAVEPEEVDLPEETIRAVVGDYTREAGVRRLERRLDRLVRKAVTRIALEEAKPPVVVVPDDLREALGRAVPREDPAERTAEPGVATGLAVSGAGGDVLFVETATMPGDGGLTLTGQLGDVMKESGEIALSYLRANSEALSIDLPDDQRIHVHFPAGAIPKDGPSAGVTMTVALISLLTGRRVRGDVAMTGEITLQGKVLPIGGVKEKVLAAHRAGLTDVILPAGNGPDVEDVPSDIRDVMNLHLVNTVSDALEIALAA